MNPSTNTPSQQISDWLTHFGTALNRPDLDAVVDLFGEDCYWRDLVAFTWNIKTLEGQAEIKAMLTATLSEVQPGHWAISEEATIKDEVIEGWFTFETAVGRGQGIVRLKAGKCWTLLTTLEELKGFEEKKGPKRDQGVAHGVFKNRKNWLERKMEEAAALGYTKQPYCVIIGGGQGGIALGARLKRLNVPTIIIEKNERPR